MEPSGPQNLFLWNPHWQCFAAWMKSFEDLNVKPAFGEGLEVVVSPSSLLACSA